MLPSVFSDTDGVQSDMNAPLLMVIPDKRENTALGVPSLEEQ